MAGRDRCGSDSVEGPLDLVMRGRRQHDVLVGARRRVTAQQRADLDGRLETAQEGKPLLPELLARPARRLEEPLDAILVVDRLRLRAEVEGQQEVIRVAEDARALELAQEVDALGRLRAALRDVAEGDDQARLPTLKVRKSGAERDRVAVHVRDEGDAHEGELTGRR